MLIINRLGIFDMGMLDGKVALVTGAGGGLGETHALLLAMAITLLGVCAGVKVCGRKCSASRVPRTGQLRTATAETVRGVMAALVMLLVSNIRRTRYARQQTAFIDSVSHELRSPPGGASHRYRYP